jgi:hypothetical protein
MNPSRKVLLALVTGLGISTTVFAGTSNKNPNPFGNGSYFSQNGTFSAVLRSTAQPNFLGVVQVSTSTSAYTNSTTNGLQNTGWATVFTPAVQNYTNIVQTAVSTFTTNYLNIPACQWNGPAFGVISGSSGSTLAVTYSLQSAVSQVYTNNNNITLLTSTNLNGGGQFSANLNNNYPNQNFTGTGFCSVQPALGGNPTNTTPVLNFTNTVSGVRLSL